MTEETTDTPVSTETQEELFTRMNLAFLIQTRFTDLSAVQLRRWYVDTFVMDPTNLGILDKMEGNAYLERMFVKSGWHSIEHAAIGSRLLFALKPELFGRVGNIFEPDDWRNEDQVTATILRLLQPWKRLRFDPEGENWYTAIEPGQWRRHGKGAPGQNAAEQWIKRWLADLEWVENTDLYREHLPDLTGWDVDTIAAKATGTVKAFQKYSHATMTKTNIRRALEREPLMHLDTNTLNQIKTVAPFANGAVVLVRSWYPSPDGKRQIPILPGELKPLDIEYMVTNANSLPWQDPDHTIPKAASMFSATNRPDGTMDVDFYGLEDRMDSLLLHDCPTYWSFLTHAFPETAERSAFLRLLGAAMYGTNIKIVAAMIGEPNAGKDTVINWLSYLMPGQVATLPFSAFTPYGDEDRGFAPLLGRRVATVSGEVGEGRGSKLLAEKIKTVSSGGGKIRVAEKYEKPTDIWFDGMLFLQGNGVPSIVGGDRALYTNRLVAVEFKHPFSLVSGSFEDRYRAEAPWFAQVLFINYLIYLESGGGMGGINPPESWRKFAQEFADAANPHGFLESAIVPSTEPVPTHQFHQALSAMVGKFGSPFQVGPNFWPKRLRAMGYHTDGPHSVRRKIMRTGVTTWCYMLTVDADKSDGAFTQMQWDNTLKDAAVTS